MIITSSIMIAYVMNYWPCARYSDNVSKIGNELIFIAMLVNCIYLKEMANSVSNLSPSVSPAQAGQGAGNFMIFLTCLTMVFHGGKLTQNMVQAGRELHLRRQTISAKLLGPPVINDPRFSNDSSSGSELEDGPSIIPLRPPKINPKIDRKFFAVKIHMLQFPEEVVDEMIIMPDVIPFLYQANIDEPKYQFDESSWPKANKDCLPWEPYNDMGISLPEITESVPGEP